MANCFGKKGATILNKQHLLKCVTEDDESDKKSTRPFLKWPGGKRWFVSGHDNFLPKKFKRYIEPFLGGGSVFFHLKPKRSILGDVNADLIATYQSVREDWAGVERLLQRHQRKHKESHYYLIRDTEPQDDIERAARLIYLNRTCFNGVYRVNRSGKFNVPMGDRESVLFDNDDFEEISRLLANADLQVADFEDLINEAKEDDLVFADPPYTVRHNINGFIKYNENLFSWKDQIRLANALMRARDRGARIVSTNANHSSVRGLYRERGFYLKTVSRFSSISADSINRNQFGELIVLGDPG